ncbi:MAG: HAD-IIIA family hydrolase [Dorea sp.]|nr:HAD-IIIA family hydrolase [Dorea sp.]
MFHLLYPYEYADSVFAVDYQRLYDKGYRGIVFDIDNTLVPHGEPSTPEVDTFIKNIQQIGLKTLFITNNDEPRVRLFLENIDSLYICDADKPKPGSFKIAAKMLGLKKKQVIVIGDQIFTDILGANLAGLASILVGYIGKGQIIDIGKRRHVENVILKTFDRCPYFKHRLERVQMKTKENEVKEKKPAKEQMDPWIRFFKREILFCDINPTCFTISEKKEVLKRKLRDYIRKENFASERTCNKLACVVSTQSSNLIKKGKGIDPVSQYNKATNIGLACDSMCGLIVHPGETFSFWKLVGETTEKRGYKAGRVIENNVLKPGLGGGLCNLANTLHLLVLDTPMEVTELHTHSDALAPDHGPHKPFATGTSVSYNNIDFRFKNTTDQKVQILVWTEDEKLFGEFRAERPFANTYRLVEEDHHFRKEGEKYFRVSKIYRETINKETGNVIAKDLLLDNHSEVMFDYSQIPAELIRQ